MTSPTTPLAWNEAVAQVIECNYEPAIAKYKIVVDDFARSIFEPWSDVDHAIWALQRCSHHVMRRFTMGYGAGMWFCRLHGGDVRDDKEQYTRYSHYLSEAICQVIVELAGLVTPNVRTFKGDT